ncbi:MAG: hypothetical protein IID31_14070 [Planctomycetes bacterium]|nr:hypothetical protein [Planctomycetota bacterium]
MLIAPGVTYFDRTDWGARASIRGGHLMDGAAEKIEIPVHHTVIVDNDATPDLWETIEEVKAKMRQLQVIRADITDVPYNGVGFLMANGDLIVCEGRGPNRSGAHTIGHNRKGYGFALEGNFEAAPNPNVSLWVPKLNRFFGWLKAEQLPRLGEVATGHAHGAHQFFPHQDVSATACPGRAVIPQIRNFRYETEAEEEDEAMAGVEPFLMMAEETDELPPELTGVFATDGMRRWHVPDMQVFAELQYVGFRTKTSGRAFRVRPEFIAAIPLIPEGVGGQAGAALASHAADHDAHEGNHD